MSDLEKRATREKEAKALALVKRYEKRSAQMGRKVSPELAVAMVLVAREVQENGVLGYEFAGMAMRKDPEKEWRIDLWLAPPGGVDGDV